VTHLTVLPTQEMSSPEEELIDGLDKVTRELTKIRRFLGYCIVCLVLILFFVALYVFSKL
jgi:hypothetical protein